MANNFSKQVNVAFDKMCAGFEDALPIVNKVEIYNTDQVAMARANEQIWAPAEYIMQSFDGTDQSGNFKNVTQMSIPRTISYSKVSPWLMSARDLTDALQSGRLLTAAKEKLSSDINVAVLNAAVQGTLTVKRVGALTGYDDIAAADTLMNQTGVADYDRMFGLSSASYNTMAGNLSAASRSFGNSKSDAAYEKGRVGEVCNFDTFKMPYTRRIAAAAGSGLTMSTLDAAAQYYIPAATRIASTGEQSNVDNRYQTITISSTTGVVANDRFTVANVYAVHQITKEDTGVLKPFRVVSVDSATTMTISPPMITNQVANDASAQYQNCTVTTKSGTAALVWLNTAAADINPFWHKGSIQLLPGKYTLPMNSGANIMHYTTSNGINIVFQEQYDIQTMSTFFRVDCLFGTVNAQPEMSGIMIGGQS